MSHVTLPYLGGKNLTYLEPTNKQRTFFFLKHTIQVMQFSRSS